MGKKGLLGKNNVTVQVRGYLAVASRRYTFIAETLFPPGSKLSALAPTSAGEAIASDPASLACDNKFHDVTSEKNPFMGKK